MGMELFYPPSEPCQQFPPVSSLHAKLSYRMFVFSSNSGKKTNEHISENVHKDLKLQQL